jgi:hypothetical protein
MWRKVFFFFFFNLSSVYQLLPWSALDGEEAPRWAHIVRRTELQPKALFTLVGLGNYYSLHRTAPCLSKGFTPRNSPCIGLCVYWGPLTVYTDYTRISLSALLSLPVKFTVLQAISLAPSTGLCQHSTRLVTWRLCFLVCNPLYTAICWFRTGVEKDLFNTFGIRVVISLFYLPTCITTPVGNSTWSLTICYINFPTINFPLPSPVSLSGPAYYRIMCRGRRSTPSPTNNSNM